MSESNPRRGSLMLPTLLAAVLSLATQPVLAADEPTIHLSGFGTAGVVAQSVPDSWGLMRNSAQPGPTQDLSLTPDSRLGMQLDWHPRPDLEGTVQAVLYKRPEGTPASEAIEWAYLGWRPTADSRLRLGRTSPDTFLFANSRHIGYAWPWVRPPLDMYGFTPLNSLDGIEGSHQWLDGDATWLLRGAIGQFSATSASVISGVESIPIKGKDTFVLTAQRESEGLLIKASYAQARQSMTLPDDFYLLTGALDQLAAIPVPGLAEQVASLRSQLWLGGPVRYGSLGVQHDAGPWLTHAEVSRLQTGDNKLLSAWRGYVSLGYRWRDMTFYGVAGRTLADKAPIAAPRVDVALEPAIGPAGATQAQALVDATAGIANAYRQDQHSVTLGLRWDLTTQAALKFQVDQIHVHRHGAAMWRSDDRARAANNTLASIAFDFVWGP